MDGHTRGFGSWTEPRLQVDSPSPLLSRWFYPEVATILAPFMCKRCSYLHPFSGPLWGPVGPVLDRYCPKADPEPLKNQIEKMQAQLDRAATIITRLVSISTVGAAATLPDRDQPRRPAGWPRLADQRRPFLDVFEVAAGPSSVVARRAQSDLRPG